MVKTATFDTADYLTDEETIAEYLTAALEDPNPDVFLAAVRDLARARGMAQLATDAGLGRESLYKALTPGAKPRYDTLLKHASCSGGEDFCNSRPFVSLAVTSAVRHRSLLDRIARSVPPSKRQGCRDGKRRLPE